MSETKSLDWADSLRRIAGATPELGEAIRENMKVQDDRAEADHRRWSELWHLSLAVGNGAGLLGVAGFILSGDAAAWRDALLLSAWLFFCGLLAGGSLPAQRTERLKIARKMIAGLRSALHDPVGAKSPTFGDRAVHLKKLMEWTTRIAVFAFLAGILVPLVSITLWKEPGKPQVEFSVANPG